MSCRRRMQRRIQRIHDLGPVAVILHRLAQKAGLRRRPERCVVQREGMRERSMGLQEQANLLWAAVEPQLFKKLTKRMKLIFHGYSFHASSGKDNDRFRRRYAYASHTNQDTLFIDNRHFAGNVIRL